MNYKGNSGEKHIYFLFQRADGWWELVAVVYKIVTPELAVEM